MADSSDEDSDFGQKLPPLHIYLKRVLDKYPEGGQILKELVQNADDANAKNVIFLYDKSQHPDRGLWSDTLRGFQGAALYAYNDATFEKEDWHNIQHPEQSGKLEDLSKVGRFGLGFISVYHLTDMPCIMSGSKIGFLDPLEKNFIRDPHTNTVYKGRRGKKWKMSADLLARFPDQFSPFLIDLFNCGQTNFHRGKFEGTIFRFPLRTRPSVISKSTFTDNSRVHALVESFQRDAEISLLFLKYVESIAVYERNGCHETPRLICKVQISAADRGPLRLNRTTFLNQISLKQDFQTENCVRIEKQLGQQAVAKISRYITVNTLKNRNTSSRLQELINDDDLKLLPWVGMSFRINSVADPGTDEQSGRVFCFLPLPESEKTGLPVHVHGYFGLGDNRRSIKWPDRESQHDKASLWNKLLSTEVFPGVYAKLFLAARDRSKDRTDPMAPADVYRGWPCFQQIKAEWSDAVKNFVRLMANEAIFYTDYNGGSWMKPSDLYVDTTRNPMLSKVLHYKGNPVAQLPDHVLESLRWAGVQYQEVTPAILRNHIRGDPLQFLSRREKLQLLEYVTSDTISDLNNLCLLPLQSGEFTVFSRAAPTVYIATTESPSSLIPNGGSRFAASDLPALLTNPTVEACTQLKRLAVGNFVPLLREMLPSTWRTGTDDTVQWTPGRNQQPPERWLEELWIWLSNNHMWLDLGMLEGIPLVPVGSNRLARLQKGRLIYREQRSSWMFSVTSLSDNICLFLESVGAVVVRHDLPANIRQHPHLSRFIKAPTGEGVMTSLDACNRKVNLQRCVERLTAGTKDELRGLLSQLQQLTTQQRNILKSLPLFLATDRQYVSMSTCMTAVQSDYFGLPVKNLRYRRLIVGSGGSDNLLSLLGVHRESVDELLASNILPAVQDGFYNDSDSLKIMTWVLESARFDGLVTGLKFIPIRGCKASPTELFEPNRTLSVLFRGNNVFPTGAFSCGKLLTLLKRVGLKNETHVTSVDVLRCAMELSQTDVERGSVLLQHINRYPHLLPELVTSNRINKPLHKFLEDLSWVPCEASPPQGYPVTAGWFGNSKKLYSPRQIGLIETALLQGSVLPLVKLANPKDELLNVFSWSKHLDPNNYQKVEQVVRQLKNVANNCQCSQETYVSHTVSVMYEFLSKAADAHLGDLFRKHIGASQSWVWHGSGFTTPEKMAFSIGALILTPYLHIVPQDFRKYKGFLSRMGVQPTFQENALCEVLQRIHQKHQATLVPCEQDYETDLNLVCSILRHMVSRDGIDTSSILVPCRVPRGRDGHLHMALSSECLYVDEERLARQLFDEGSRQDFDKPIIHELIPNSVAQKLGLTPLSHCIAPVDAVDYGYDVAGPHETTVNAIKRNLEMYKKGPGIFNELIQNADDAGATEVKFLLDWRTNEKTANNLLTEGMKACHGPALWAFNDARFSKDDITNICSIAAQSKKDQLDKVGRFGLGFTSVYHLTDVPSVVSGPYVLICDPRTTHLGSRVKPGQPGIKLDLTTESHRRTLQLYPNQFQPYNGIFGCNLLESENFDHTLFRLPLRTDEEANGQQLNQISDSVFNSKKRVEPLIESLKKAASTLLLFTQNVVQVSVQELQSENVSDLKTEMLVRISRVEQMPRSISTQAADIETERNLLKATAARIQNPALGLPAPETTMIVKVTQETRATGKGIKSKPKKKVRDFIISSCMATGQPVDLAQSQDGRKAGVLPCGGVAAELVSGERGLTPTATRGNAFSYLPLDLSTGLRFHVNGNFLLQPNRRQLWSKPSSETGEFETRWNICFMESVLLRAFVNLLEDLQEIQGQNKVDARNFQCLWPRRSESESDFYPFVDAFYQKIGSSEDAPAVFFNQSRWVPVHQCFFTDWNQTDPEDLRSSIRTLLNRHREPKRCIELEENVVSSIKKSRANKSFDDNTFNIQRFLRVVFFPMLKEHPEDIEPIDRNRIVLHMLDLRLGERKLPDFDKLLQSTDCIPTSPDGEDLASPDLLVDPNARIGSLYSEVDSRFPHGESYRNANRLLSLSQLGMASLDLPWDDICDRAESMSGGDNFVQRCVTLLKLIDEKRGRTDEPTSEQKRRIQNAAFLPVLKRPLNYPVKWYACDEEFLSADKLHASKHKDLLGSVQPLLDEGRLGSEAMTKRVKTFLGFTGKQVAVSDVMEQLGVIRHTHALSHQASAMVHSIYSFLQETVCELSTEGNLAVGEEYRVVVDQLCCLKFILCGGKFQECKQFAFQYEGKNGPYLYRVPLELLRFSNLLKICGVRDRFQVEDFLHTLKLLKENNEDQPLNESDMKTAKAMLSEIVSGFAGIHGDHDDDGKKSSLPDGIVFVPDHHGVLRSTQELTFNDMKWEGSHENEIYTHPDVSHRDARVLGIITQRQKYIDSCSSFGGFETDFGQSEELTDRLRNILRSYPNVSDVFKELLQNADDAGSTEIHFVYDTRRRKAEKVISDSWAKVDKLPSLCVYNDKPFTEEDIMGIQKVGVGGKRDDIATTGKFGIGFNAVYHLTDCPSFLSNSNSLCVFDPLLKYSPVTRKTSPGKRLETNSGFREKFPDMLKGYLEDIDDFSKKGGTMFRFPLREQPSELSGEVYSSFRVRELLDDFKRISEEALLFLNNIKVITVSSIDGQTNKLTTEYRISAELSDTDEQRRADLTEHLRLFKDHPCERVEPMSRVYTLLTRDSLDTEKKWLISQMLGFDGSSLDGQSFSSPASLKKPLPRGGVAALIKDNTVAKPAPQKCKAYCFLPLPVHTRLPVHVNGAFELDSARKNLAKGDDYASTGVNVEEDDCLIHRWNRALVEHVIAPAYAKLIERAGRMILGEEEVRKPYKEQLQLYDDLFPKNLQAFHGEWSVLAKAAFRYIGEQNLRVLPVVRNGDNSSTITWHHPISETSLAFADNFGDKEKSEGAVAAVSATSKSSIVLRSFLLRIGFNLLASSPEVCEAFRACGIKAEFVSPQAVVGHLSSGSAVAQCLPALLKKTEFKDIQTFRTLFKYCLKGIEKPTDLNGLPLRLTDDDIVREFSTCDGAYVTDHSRVLPRMKEKFLHSQLVSSCTVWFEKNKTSDEAFSSGVFKKFTIFELAQHLGKQLPESWEGCEQHVQWTPDKNGHPSTLWLRYLWTFICSEASENSSLECINHWPIFPTSSGKLVPPSLSKTVLSLQSFGEAGFGKKIADVLRKLGLPEIAFAPMCELRTKNFAGKQVQTLHAPSGLEQLLKKHLALPTTQEDVTCVIKFMLEKGGVIGDLTLPEGGMLLQYFQEDEKLSGDSIKIIKQLSIFKLLGQEKATDLQHSHYYHTAEDGQLLMVEARAWMEHMHCVILEQQRHLDLIYKQLEISQITHADMYVMYILPCFHLLSQKARIKHIEHIRDKILHRATKQEKADILQCLSRTEFIPDQMGILRRADFFFDGDNVVFKAMIGPIKLLPKPMGALKYFLEEIGFHFKVTQDDFFGFAKEVETRAQTLKDKTKREKLCGDSRLLTNELDLNDDLRDANFLRKIASIEFIPSVPIKVELLHIHPPFSGCDNRNHHGPPFIAYRGSVPERYLELVWSVSMVLPSLAIPGNRSITEGVTVHGCLGIETEVIADKVLSHTQNICGLLEEKNAIHKEDMLPRKEREMIKSVMGKILKYLKGLNMHKHGAEIKRRLQCTPICLVEEGRVLVRADQLVFGIAKWHESRLRPYLYKAPRELADFDAVLRLLGAQDYCSFDQLAGVLSSMRTECGEKRLGPNEQKTATCAVSAMFQLLRQEKGHCEIYVSELYLPNSAYILRNASNLYYADQNQMGHYSLATTDREFIIPLKQCGFEDKDEVPLLQLLPERLRPKNLGNEMNEKPLETNEDCPAGQNCEYLENITRKVKSEEMTRVLLRLSQHQLEGNQPSDEIRERITQLQRFDKFVCKTELKLGLYDNVGEKIAERKYSRKAHFDTVTGSVYLEHSSPSQQDNWTLRQIANSCNVLLRHLLNVEHVGIFVSALDCKSLDEMNIVLSKSDIPEYDITTRALQPDEHRLGTVIPKDIRHLLDHDPYNRFLEDEIVGYERNLDDANSGEFHRAEDDSDALALGTEEWLPSESTNSATEKIYAKIVEQVDKVDDTVNLSRRYRIDIGAQNPIIVKVTTLYKFLRPKKQSVMTVVPFTGETSADAPAAAFDDSLPEDMQRDEEQIKKEVEEVFGLPPEERKRVLYRLYRKWHPDKNPGQQERANEAFKFLKQEIDGHEKKNQSSQRWSGQFSSWESEVHRDREEARRYQERYYQSQRTSRENSSSSNFVPPSFTKETPDLRTARLWFRQAKEHFKTAEQTSQLRQAPTQWIAFQVHQAAEIALKAAQYSLDGRPDMKSNDLISLARTVCQHRDVPSDKVLEVTLELVRMDCHFSNPRYPKSCTSLTSGQVYRDFCKEEVLNKCKELLNLIQDIIGIRVF